MGGGEETGAFGVTVVGSSWFISWGRLGWLVVVTENARGCAVGPLS